MAFAPLFIGPFELGILLAIVLLFFGASKLPKLARALGRAPGEVQRGLESDAEE